MNLKLTFCLFSLLLCIFLTKGYATGTENNNHSVMRPLSWKARGLLKDLELEKERESVQNSFKKLNVKERGILEKILWENYAVGYYTELNGYSHKHEVRILREQSEKNLRTLKSKKVYTAVLQKLKGEQKKHMLSYIVRQRTNGLRDAHYRNMRNQKKKSTASIQAEDFFLP